MWIETTDEEIQRGHQDSVWTVLAMTLLRPIRDEDRLKHLRMLVQRATEQLRWGVLSTRAHLNRHWLAERGWCVAPVDPWVGGSVSNDEGHQADVLRGIGVNTVMAALLDEFVTYTPEDMRVLERWEEEMKDLLAISAEPPPPPPVAVECITSWDALNEMREWSFGRDFIVLDDVPRFIKIYGDDFELWAGPREFVEQIVGKSIPEAVEDYLAINENSDLARRVVERYAAFY